MSTTYVTPRQRDLVIQGTISGGISDNWVYQENPCDPPPPLFSDYETASHVFTWSVADGSGFVFGFPGTLWGISAGYQSMLIPPNTHPHPVRGILTLSGGFQSFPPYGPASDTDTIQIDSTVPHTYNFADGSFTVTIPVEHCFEIPDDFGTILVGPNGWPIIDGAEVIDSSMALLFRAFERPRAGTTMTLSATFGGASISASLPVDMSIFSGGGDASGFYLVQRYISGRVIDGGSRSMSISCTVGGENMSQAMGSIAGVGSNCTYSASDVGGTLSLTVANNQCEGVSTVEAYTIGEGKRRYQVAGRLRAWDSPYPGNVICNFAYKRDPLTGSAVVKQLAGPNYSDTIEQHHARTWVKQSNNQLGFGEVDEQWTPQLWLNRDSLSANGENLFDQRVQIVGRYFGTRTIQHVSSVSIDSGDSTSGWAAGANTTVTSSAGAIQMAAAGGTGSATRTFSPKNQAHEGFRYLRLRLKGDINGRTVSVVIGSKQWDLTLTNAYADYDLDLVCPSNAGAATDPQDSRWPLISSANPEPSVEGPLWGVNWVGSVSFTGIANGATIFMDDWSVRRNNDAKLSLIEPFQDWQSAYPPEAGSTTSYKRYFCAQTDGKQAWEDWAVASIAGPASTSFVMRSIAQLASSLTARPYFAGGLDTLLSWEAPAFFDNTRPAHWLGGNGATYVGGVWTEWIEKGFSSVLGMQKQSLADSHIGYPGCGDPFSDTYDGGPVPLRFTKILRWGAYGTVHDINQSPLSGTPVKMFVADNPPDLRGTGTTNSIGEYYTGLPYAKSPKAITIEPQVGSAPQITELGPNRRRKRGAFRGAAGLCDGGAWAMRDDFGRYNVVCTKGGNARFMRSMDEKAIWEVISNITATGDVTKARIVYGPSTHTITALIARSNGKVYTSVSNDDGKTWSAMSLLFDPGWRPDCDWAKGSGTAILDSFRYNSGTSGPGKIVARFRDAGDAALSAEFILKDSGGSDLVFVDDDYKIILLDDGSRRANLHAKINGETGTSHWYSLDDCRTWKRYP